MAYATAQRIVQEGPPPRCLPARILMVQVCFQAIIALAFVGWQAVNVSLAGNSTKSTAETEMEALRGGNVPRRAEACKRLASLGTRAKIAVELLTKVLSRDQIWFVRYEAAIALGEVVSKDEELLGIFRGIPADTDARVRAAVCRVICGLSSTTPSVQETICGFITDSSGRVRYIALRGLTRFESLDGKSLTAVIGRIQDPDESAREEAIRLAAKHCANLAKPHPGLLKASVGPHSAGRACSLALLVRFAATDPSIHRLIGRGLTDDAPSVRAVCAKAAGDMGAQGRTWIAKLVRLARDPDIAVRGCAIASLGRLGPLTEDASAALIASANEDDYASIRLLAVSTLGHAGCRGEKVENYLLGVATDATNSDSDVAVVGAVALAHLGRSTRETEAILLDAMSEEESRNCVRAAGALLCLGRVEGPAMAVLRKATRSQRASVRASVFDALGRLGRHGESEAKLLLRGLDDQSADVRAAAVHASLRIPAELRAPEEKLRAATHGVSRPLADTLRSEIDRLSPAQESKK